MILRSITKHLKDQNWFAVGLDFFIVVVGVFLGIQVANWNEEQAFNDRETELLYDLKKETQNSILLTNNKIDSYAQVTAAGKRSLNFISRNASCGSECWPVLVDFMHASQWQGVQVPRSVYDSMRRNGLPKDGAIVEAVEAYLAQNYAAVLATTTLPYYGDVIRQLLSVETQEFYWRNCFSLLDGVENYDVNCPKGVADDIALKAVEDILQNTEIKPHLTQWISMTTVVPIALINQNDRAEQAIAAIDAELERR